MKTMYRNFETGMSVREIGQVLNRAFGQVKGTVDPIASSQNPLDSFDGIPDIAVAAQGQGLLTGAWVVQAYVYDVGDRRHIGLVALGDGGFSRAMQGIRGSVSLSKSTEKMDAVIQTLRTSDSSLTSVQ